MSTVPRLTERHSRLVELVFKHDPGVSGFEVEAAYTLDQAFTAPTPMFRVPSPGTYRSKSVRRRRLGGTQYHNRGLARAFYDPEDFWAPAGTMPHDVDQAYLRVREIAPGGGLRGLGPIFVLPPPAFFTSPRPTLTLAGTAPAAAALPTLLPPAGAMHLVLPRFADFGHIRNRSVGTSLYLSYDPGMPQIEVPFGEVHNIFDGVVSELFLWGDGGAVAFDAQFAVVNGEMA